MSWHTQDYKSKYSLPERKLLAKLDFYLHYSRNDKRVQSSRKIFSQQCLNDQELSKFLFILCLILSPVLVLIQILLTRQRRILAKLIVGFVKRKDGFRSSDREKFINTYEAAKYLEKFTDAILSKVQMF